MTEQDQYDALQEYNYFEMLVNTKEYVTKDEYDFIINYDKRSEERRVGKECRYRWEPDQ